MRGRLEWLRLLAGPLALAGFFLPWAKGPGPFAATEFTGFTLVGFAGRLQALDLSLAQGAVLWLIRLAILGVAISATWLTVLAPAHRWHFVYSLSGRYLTTAAGALVTIGLARSGIQLPPVGLALVIGGAACFVISAVAASRTAEASHRPAGPS